MVSAQQLNELITLIDTEDRHGQPWGEESFAKLGTLVAALQPHTQFPAPVDASAADTTGALDSGSDLKQRVAALEAEVAQLRATVQDLCTQLGLSQPGH